MLFFIIKTVVVFELLYDSGSWNVEVQSLDLVAAQMWFFRQMLRLHGAARATNSRCMEALMKI